MPQILVTHKLRTEWLDNGEPLDIVYLDFKKAFDSVLHTRLVQKLKAYDVDGNLLIWLKHFLLGHKQGVTVNGSLSEWVIELSGIPQGSVSGLIFFVIFINDLLNIVLSTANIFVDDT